VKKNRLQVTIQSPPKRKDALPAEIVEWGSRIHQASVASILAGSVAVGAGVASALLFRRTRIMRRHVKRIGAWLREQGDEWENRPR